MVSPFVFGTAGAGAALAAAWSSPALAPILPPVARALSLPRQIDDPNAVALTFDDGPHPQGTPAALEALREAGALATFFLVGEQVDRNPALAAEIASAGHTIAVHGYRHRNALRLTPGQFATDLERGIDTIGERSGVELSLYRPPYGIFSPAALRIVSGRGLRQLLWSRWGHDWRRRATRETITAELTAKLTGGDVLLLHDADHYTASGSWRATVAAIPDVVAAIEDVGLRARAV